MGLFKKIKKQLLAVIEYKGGDKDQIVYRYPLTERDEIMTSSTLVVRESQAAIFMHKGQIADVFLAGTYKLKTENIPFLTKLLSLPTGFESPIKAEVYFINLRQFTGVKWGTQNPIMLKDADFGNIRVRGYGIYSFKVTDPRAFLKEMFGTNEVYTVSDVANQIRPMLVSNLTDSIAESKVTALELASQYREISEIVLKHGKEEFATFGLDLCTFVIENLSLPDEVEKALDERTKLGIMEDKMGTYTQYQAANAMRDAAQNTSGGNLAGLGIGLGAGGTVGQMFSQNLSTQNPQAKVDNVVECSNCGAKIKRRSKFCAECGARQGFNCSNCGAEVKATSKFCAECGASLKKELKCAECGAKLKAGAKFCAECGKPVK